ncbi:hypothetical protein ERJ75_001291600 [Trypanosoma vivax]|nr:hypothetical protein ERJ75_001691500 [Trypanosoma vivax]KAH8608594.1 hypothetical protein ERJ75_001291600 [Trypanosoma vivax]
MFLKHAVLLSFALVLESALAQYVHHSRLAYIYYKRDQSDMQKCAWLHDADLARRHAGTARRLLNATLRKLTSEHTSFVAEVSEAGAAGHHPGVVQALEKAKKIYWEITEQTKNGMRAASDISTETYSWWLQAVDEWKSVSRRNDCSLAYTSKSNHFNTVRNDLEETLRLIIKVGKEEKAPHFDAYIAKISAGMESLKKAAGDIDRITKEVKKAYAATKEAITVAEKEKGVLDEKVVVACEMEKKLNIMKDTFTALTNVTKHVIKVEAGLAKLAKELRVRAKDAGVDGIDMTDTKHARGVASGVKADVSSTLQNIVAAEHDAQQKFHELLADGMRNDKKLRCTGSDRVERAVLLRMVADERKHHLDDFDEWRSATNVMWQAVTNVPNSLRTSCEKWGGADCEKFLARTNSVMESARQSRVSVETRLENVIKVLLKVEAEVKMLMARLAAKRRGDTNIADIPSVQKKHERDDGETDDAAEDNNAVFVADYEIADSDRLDLERAMMGVVSSEGEEEEGEQAELGNGSVSAMKSAKNSVTITVAVAVPVVVVIIGAATWFVLSRRNQVAKNVPLD